jgi:formate dehydrogenase major subunit
VPDAEYPMVLSTGRVLEHGRTGSMTRRSTVLDRIEPEALAFMSPKDMRRLSEERSDEAIHSFFPR